MKHIVAFLRIFFALIFIIAGVSGGSVATGVGVSQQGNDTIYLPLVASPLTPIIPESTNVLTASTTQLLTAISTAGTFTFSQMTPELAKVTPGEVMTGGVSDTAPNGFLRKVTRISTSGGQVIVETTAATVEEAIEQGEVSLTRDLAPTDVQDLVLASGVTALEQSAFSLEIKDVVLYDADGNQQTKNDQIRANGKITLEPSFTFKLAIRQWQIDRLDFTHTVKRTTALTVEAKATATVVKQKVEIARYAFTPITVFVGLAPMVFMPELTVQVGLDGSAYVGISAGVTQQATLTAGVTYQNRTWTPVNAYTSDFDYTLPTLSSGLTVKGEVGAQLSLRLYGIVGPSIGVKGYLKLQANPTATPWWQLYGGLEVPLGVEVTILSQKVAGYQATLIDYQKLLAEAQVASAYTCGEFFYVNQGLDHWPVFLPNGSLEPWFIDPAIADIFEEGQSALIDGARFLKNDWGALGPYENVRWLAGSAGVDYVSDCPAVEPNNSLTFSAASGTSAGIYLINAAGGDVRKLAAMPGNSGSFNVAQCATWSPTGAEIAFFKKTGLDFGDIFIMRSDGSATHNSTNNIYWYGKLAWSPVGTQFAYYALADSIHVIPVDSGEAQWVGISMSDENPGWSPDGQRLVFDSDVGSSREIYSMKLDKSDLQQLTTNASADIDPAWSPDGTKIAFVSNRDGDDEIFIMNSNGSNVQQLTNNAAVDSEPTWSPTGAFIAFVSERDGNHEIYVMQADGTNQHNLTNTPFQEYCPDWFGIR